MRHDRQSIAHPHAYAKASLPRSLEGLTQGDLLWQPAPGRTSIGWNGGMFVKNVQRLNEFAICHGA
jgi:hypothetical protein